jgi:uncharacterized protein (TIGR01777 family)
VRVLVAGSSGLLGSALRRHLAIEGHEVVPLVRTAPSTGERSWDPAGGTIDPAIFDGIDAVVNLTGVGIGDRRLTRRRLHAVTESRVGPTALLAASMAGRADRPSVFLSQSAIGLYGDTGDEIVTETSSAGDGVLADLVVAWERAARPAASAGIRTVWCRTGVVLAAGGGLLGRLAIPFKLGIGGRLGSGSQWWSWITIADWTAAMSHLLVGDLEGPVNVTAPEPVTNADFSAALGRALHRPAKIPVPAWALRVALGDRRADALALGSARVIPERLTSDGFEFAHPDIDTALAAVLAPR